MLRGRSAADEERLSNRLIRTSVGYQAKDFTFSRRESVLWFMHTGWIGTALGWLQEAEASKRRLPPEGTPLPLIRRYRLAVSQTPCAGMKRVPGRA